MISHFVRRAPVLSAYLLIHLGVALGYVVISIYPFVHMGRRAGVLHLLLLALLLGLNVFAMTLVVQRRRVRQAVAMRLGVGLVLALQSFALIWLYVVDFVSNRLWGSNVSLRLISVYLPRFGELVDTLPVPNAGIYVALLGSAVGIAWMYANATVPLIADVTRVFARETGKARQTVRGRPMWVAAGLVVLVALVAGARSQQLFSGEPFTELFFPWTDFPETEHRLRQQQADALARETYTPPDDVERRHVILIIADALRADHMSVYGYHRPTTPFLDSLYHTGRLHRVEMALATCPRSTCAVLSTLASKDFRSLSHRNFKLNDLLHDLGYRVSFVLSGDASSWYDFTASYQTGVDHYFDGMDAERHFVTDDRVLFEGLETIPDYDGTPHLLYLHLLSAHFVGVKQSAYQRYQPARMDVNVRTFFEGGYETEELINSYDNGVLQADAVIRQLFAVLNAKGYLERSLVIILGDHGEALGEHGHFGHTRHLYQEELWIPFLIFDPGDTTYASLDYASQLDIAPTVIDRLGLPIPEVWQGQSLLKPPPDVRYTTHQTALRRPSFALVRKTPEETYKYVWRGAHEPAGHREELYALHRDPAEQNNVIAVASDSLVNALRVAFKEHVGVEPIP